LPRTLHRLGYRWKRPKFVLGRPDRGYAEKKAVSPLVAKRWRVDSRVRLDRTRLSRSKA